MRFENAAGKWLKRLCLVTSMSVLFPEALVAKTAGVWREAFQSSPAEYEPIAIETQKKILEQLKLPVSVMDSFKPKPATGTMRMRFAVTVSGSQIRVRLSNEDGKAPLQIKAASLGFAGDGFAAKPGSLKPLTFGGRSEVVIPPGAPLLSDPIALNVSEGSEFLVSVYTQRTVMLSIQGGGLIAVGSGDQSLDDRLEGPVAMSGRPLLSGAEVLSVVPTHVIATLGDSITDGNRPNLIELRGWPQQLARRLAQRKGKPRYSVVNAGIGGNRVLAAGSGQAALARLDRDVLRIEGLTHIIVLEGTNDIGLSGQSMFGDNPEISADDLIGGYRQMIARAHARSVKVILATITPFGSAPSFTANRERIRQTVNNWIRTSKEMDGVIDFDQIARDPAKPANMRQEFGSADGLHPGEVGYKLMGDAVDLELFE